MFVKDESIKGRFSSQKDGLIALGMQVMYLNSGIAQRMGLDNYTHATLYYDNERCLLGVELHDGEREGSRKLRRVNKGRQVAISVQATLNKMGFSRITGTSHFEPQAWPDVPAGFMLDLSPLKGAPHATVSPTYPAPSDPQPAGAEPGAASQAPVPAHPGEPGGMVHHQLPPVQPSAPDQG